MYRHATHTALRKIGSDLRKALRDESKVTSHSWSRLRSVLFWLSIASRVCGFSRNVFGVASQVEFV